MGTLVKSISFQNFYNYYGSYDENEYKFTEGINIINADNNMGKSKFYNGFLWILRNEVYDSDDKNIHSVKESYHKMLSKKASRESNELEMGVRIVFDNEGEQYKITKRVKCVYDKDWQFYPSFDVIKTIGNNDSIIYDVKEKEDAIRKFIPNEMERFSMLQGESMERLVDLSTLQGLAGTIRVLADIENLVQMCEKSKDLVAAAKNECKREEKLVSSQDKDILNLQKNRDELEKWIEDAKEKVLLAKSQYVLAKEEETRFESDFYSSGKREKMRKEYTEATDKLIQLQNQKVEEELSITSRLFDENCPWLLFGLDDETSVFDELRIALSKELAKNELLKNPAILLPEGSPDTPSLKRMLERCHCEVCDRDAPKNSEAWLHIKHLLERPQQPMRVSESFMQFYGEVQKTTGRYSVTIPQIEENYQKYLDNIDNIDDLIKQQEKTVDRLGSDMTLIGVENSSSERDKSILSSYNKAKKTINEKTSEINYLTNRIKIWNEQLDKTRQELSEKQQSAPIKKAEKIYSDLLFISEVFEKTKERIFDEIVDKLQSAANEMYGGLTKGNQTLGGTLKFEKDDNGAVKVKVLDAIGEELYGNGTGFQRMKQLAIVMSIISSKSNHKSFDYPFISDAPFSEFSMNFINNFFDIAPNVFRQSIIMIKDFYDPLAKDYLRSEGLSIVNKMKNNELMGTFYVNYIEEKADAANIVTKKLCYTNND